MTKNEILKSKLRIEKSVQDSGSISISSIPNLKNENYYLVDVPLDGDAPKQYIKAYFYYYNCPRKSRPKNWDGYYAKFGGKSYPHESVMEFGINKIGEALGLNMNETFLVTANEQIRFLSKDFIMRGRKKLIHGVEMLHEYFEDKDFIDEINEDRKNRRELLTFDVIESAFQHVHPKQCTELLLELVKLITFDAIVGNNDRHFYNWGVIGNIKYESNKKVHFAPIYDTARGLLWNKVESKVIEMYKQYKNGHKVEIEAFIRKSRPRFSFDGNSKANHFELIEYLAKRKPEYKTVISNLIDTETEKSVYLKLNSEVFRYLSNERSFLVSEILKLRFNKLRELIHA